MTDTRSFFDAGRKLVCQLRQLHPETNESFHWDNIGDANLFMTIFENSVCYAPDRAVWYVFDGTRWALDNGNVMIDEKLKFLAQWLREYARKIASPILQDGYLKYVNRWTQRRTRDTILRDARSIRPVKSTAFDRDPWLLNVANGTIDLRSGKAHSHKPDEMQSRLAPVKFDPTYCNGIVCRAGSEPPTAGNAVGIWRVRCFIVHRVRT